MDINIPGIGSVPIDINMPDNGSTVVPISSPPSPGGGGNSWLDDIWNGIAGAIGGASAGIPGAGPGGTTPGIPDIGTILNLPDPSKIIQQGTAAAQQTITSVERELVRMAIFAALIGVLMVALFALIVPRDTINQMASNAKDAALLAAE